MLWVFRTGSGETCCGVWWGRRVRKEGKAETQQQEDVVQSVPLDRGQRGQVWQG